MATGRTVQQKLQDWSEAFEFIDRNLNVPEIQTMLDTMMAAQGVNGEPFATSIALARMKSANLRAAAVVAALVTQTGIKPVDIGEAVEE